jgi:hypothetical protein
MSFSEAEVERYARHLVLREVGGPGQQKLKTARVLVVGAGGLGAPAWDITSTGDHPLSFPMWGAMGGAAMIGLGLALDCFGVHRLLHFAFDRADVHLGDGGHFFKVQGFPPRVQNMVLLMLAAAFDHGPMFNRPADEALHLEEVAAIAKVDIGAIKREVQQAMNAEAVERAAEADAEAAAPADKAKPTIKPKGKGKAVDGTGKASQAEVMAGIAQAMNAAQPPASNDFEPGQHVRVRIDLKNAKGKLMLTKGAKGVITSKTGDRAWMLNVPDLQGANGLIADYTELEAVDA